MNWTNARLAIYLAGLAASGLALAGYADFDPVTGVFDARPFNLYALIGSLAGGASSVLATLAVVFKWGRK